MVSVGDRATNRMGRGALAAVALGLLVAGPALATTVLRFTREELTDRAEVIVHGTCSDVRGRVTPSGVVTDVDLDVIDALKGVSGPRFTFTTYGGVTPERGTFIAGAPTFRSGEEVVLFLDKRNKDGCRLAIGMAQGKYTVREEAGRKVALRNLTGLRFLDSATGDVQEAASEEGVPLADLLRDIRTQVARPAADPAGDGR
jgi:hypothetical protein